MLINLEDDTIHGDGKGLCAVEGCTAHADPVVRPQRRWVNLLNPGSRFTLADSGINPNARG